MRFWRITPTGLFGCWLGLLRLRGCAGFTNRHAIALSGSPVDTMRGRYWTDRDTQGELVFKERCPTLADDYASAAVLFE